MVATIYTYDLTAVALIKSVTGWNSSGGPLIKRVSVVMTHMFGEEAQEAKEA